MKEGLFLENLLSLDENIKLILNHYSTSFTNKIYSDENNDSDVLMDVFNITPDLKRENRQYWGRELGKAWERIVSGVFEDKVDSFQPPERYGRDEPYDFAFDNFAIDTKYRVGSGDAGTLKKFKQYGELLINQGWKPVFLILREDNLPAAISAIKAGGWEVYTGEESFNFIQKYSSVDLDKLLLSYGEEFFITRTTTNSLEGL